MIENPVQAIPTVNDIRIIERKGPWGTKSGGQLSVLMGLPLDIVERGFFHYEPSELERIPQDIRGLRAYTVQALREGQVGANEWHRVRNELVFATNGVVKWTCEDLYGEKREFTLSEEIGVWTPAFILHTYESKKEIGGLLVIANTLFIAEDPRTHDTYSRETFHELQEQIKSNR